jgi:cytochrome c peroxidase
MKKRIFFILFVFITIFAFRFRSEPIFVAPKNWPKTSYDFKKNPLTPNKILLGRVLFYDPILSKNNTISCASCHSQYTAFTHVDHALSHGIGDSIGMRNSLALMNLAWHTNFMWDGSINHLDMQALAPISHPSEMGENIKNVIAKLQHSQLYPALFYQAFNDSIINGERLLKSISQFMLTLVSSNSKYDSVMRGKGKFTSQEERGYLLFKKNCNTCHTEPLFTNLQFENNGLSIDPFLKDYGRFRVSQNPQDSFKFKVPTLRNIEFSYPYMHDGRFKKISEVLNHYVSQKSKVSTLAKELSEPFLLSSNEKVDLTAFLLTLTDKHFLFNPSHSYPREVFFGRANGK